MPVCSANYDSVGCIVGFDQIGRQQGFGQFTVPINRLCGFCELSEKAGNEEGGYGGKTSLQKSSTEPFQSPIDAMTSGLEVILAGQLASWTSKQRKSWSNLHNFA